MFNLHRIRSRIYLKKHDVTLLAEIGKFILSLCVDLKPASNDPIFPVEHHLPLRDSSKSDQDANNWDLSNSEIRLVRKCLKKLISYANHVISTYYDECSDLTEILPLWLVFPTYSATTIGWRMGIGEQYEIVYIKMLAAMSNEALTSYISKYPAPEYMRVRSRYYDN